MKAAAAFAARVEAEAPDAKTLRVELYGSLAYTGEGHGTAPAILWGLSGLSPEDCDLDALPARLETIRNNKRLALSGGRDIAFDESAHLIARRGERLEYHSNAMRFSAFGDDGETLLSEEYYSVGGGFIVTGAELAKGQEGEPGLGEDISYPFESGDALLRLSDLAAEFELFATLLVELFGPAGHLPFDHLDQLREAVSLDILHRLRGPQSVDFAG